MDTFFPDYIHRFENQRKILHIFFNSNAKKESKIFGVIEYINEYFFGTCRRQIQKKWHYQLKNFLKNIIWHLFGGESHQVMKITFEPVEENEKNLLTKK